MGWTFSTHPKTAKEAKSELLAELGPKALDSGGSGNEFYVLLKGDNGKSFIFLFLLQSVNGCVGYKDMDETAYPYYYNCPKRILDKADPPQTESAAKWRSACRTVAKAKANRARFVRDLKPGMTVALKEGCKPSSLTVTSVKPLLGEANGRVYRIRPSLLA